MKLRTIASLTLSFSGVLSGTTFAITSSSNIYLAKSTEYTKQSMKLDRALQLTTGHLKVNSLSVPSTAIAAWKLFVKACVPSVRNDRYAKTLTVSKTNNLTILNFQCDNKSDFQTIPDAVQFIATLDQAETLVDLQIMQFSTERSRRADIKTDDSSDVLLEVGAGTLIDGLLAKADQNAENNSRIVNSIAGSLVAVASTALAYRGLDITKKQAYWIGVASGVIAGLLKGAYDSYANQELDASNQVNHKAGFIPNNIDISFKIKF
ncbi:hypothetical protein B9G69_006695 [Bdellovibrio sp. SKB1291214]|uniref:hypothetical protein n=1 Tax=Bdellovibrio sp. SKB1291214 TaxID=1732569 RepID=UPI000B5197B5|nr:hypothetical protein [Bdellovibrio sp. SKB1291214]UYL10266.1 hypothetical protein B9G69_006695 [Bdellovibrio sp. SKB1291214]